ncbi:hypothetical protein GCM10010123_07380 [Pilimelia anulata]|uniref:Solute-binding protein family 3/N-terminal domain-containing protein n=1 Tax=Pilimelia anulata TaxID=53371 RepID=A0A8J3B7T1_9ACTN|nr:transporter substrate-binding domain-containing protein [Pilimelia anulata]GGJ80025.1 hypothetical protein GCM10010123_07380 [Pilimelia anulata]
MLREWTGRLGALGRRQLMAVGAAFASLLLIAGVGGFALVREAADDTVDAYLAKAGLTGKRELRIGVFTDEPLMALRDPAKPSSSLISDYTGFDIELARQLGRYLGFDEANLIMVPTEVQNRAQDLSEGRVDVIIASYSMTKERESEVDFAGPYLMTKPEVLMRADRAPARLTLRELGAMSAKVCTTGSSTSENALRANGIAGFDGVARATDCVNGLRSGRYDAFMLDKTVLYGFQQKYPELRIVDLVFGQSESYAIAVADGNEPLRVLVGNFLYDSYQRGEQGAWAQAWRASFAAVVKERARQPRPRDVAVQLSDYNDRYEDERSAGGR